MGNPTNMDWSKLFEILFFKVLIRILWQEEDLTRSIVEIVKLKLSILSRLEHRLSGLKVAISLGLICI